MPPEEPAARGDRQQRQPKKEGDRLDERCDEELLSEQDPAKHQGTRANLGAHARREARSPQARHAPCSQSQREKGGDVRHPSPLAVELRGGEVVRIPWKLDKGKRQKVESASQKEKEPETQRAVIQSRCREKGDGTLAR